MDWLMLLAQWLNEEPVPPTGPRVLMTHAPPHARHGLKSRRERPRVQHQLPERRNVHVPRPSECPYARVLPRAHSRAGRIR